MKNFCTDIQETARLRGLERDKRFTEEYVREIEITITYEDGDECEPDLSFEKQLINNIIKEL